jgi:DNA-binding NarL/FixJ family response regulator
MEDVRLTLAAASVDGLVRTAMQPQTAITLVTARFDDLLAGGLRELIAGDPSLEVLAADVEHARLAVVLRAHKPSVAILDVHALAKFSDVSQLADGQPATRLVVFANDLSAAECAQLLAFGVSACIRSDTQSRDVRNAIHLASRGLQVIPRTASTPHGGSIAGGRILTPREAEVLPLLQCGHSNAQIALALHIGTETVRTHARNIYRKLGISSRRELRTPPRAPAPEREAASTQSPRRRAVSVRPRTRRGQGLRHVR